MLATVEPLYNEHHRDQQTCLLKVLMKVSTGDLIYMYNKVSK